MKGKIAFIAIACLIFAGCIGPVNENPRAKMSVDKTIVFVGDEITFNASKSKDPEGSKLVYIWNFGDTKTEEGSDLKITKHKYDGDGIYNVVLRVKDDKGAKSSPVNSTVIVAPLPKASESKVLTYTNITFSVNTTKIDTAIKSIKWDFGDGDKGEGASVIHEYKDNKEYKVVLNITDKNGNSATSTLTVTIENRAPIAEISITTKPDDIYSNAEVKFNGKTSKDMDAKNPANPIAKYDWEFGDGSIANGSEVSHVYLLPRNYTVNLTVTDDDGATNKTTTTIIVKKDLVIIIEEINVTFYRDPVSNATKANVSVKYDNYMTQKDANTIVVEVSTYNPEQPTKPIEVKNITSAGSVGPGSYDRQTIREIGVVQGTPENTEFLIRIYYKGNLIDEYRYKTA